MWGHTYRVGFLLLLTALVATGCGFLGETDTTAEPIRGFNGEIVEDGAANTSAWADQSADSTDQSADSTDQSLAFAEDADAGVPPPSDRPAGRDDWIHPESAFEIPTDGITLTARDRLSVIEAETFTPDASCPNPELMQASNVPFLLATWEGMAGPAIAVTVQSSSFEGDGAQANEQVLRLGPECLGEGISQSTREVPGLGATGILVLSLPNTDVWTAGIVRNNLFVTVSAQTGSGGFSDPAVAAVFDELVLATSETLSAAPFESEILISDLRR